jgi:hypothetical protein
LEGVAAGPVPDDAVQGERSGRRGGGRWRVFVAWVEAEGGDPDPDGVWSDADLVGDDLQESAVAVVAQVRGAGGRGSAKLYWVG